MKLPEKAPAAPKTAYVTVEPNAWKKTWQFSAIPILLFSLSLSLSLSLCLSRPYSKGANGFLGCNIVEQLAVEGWEVIATHREGSNVGVGQPIVLPFHC